MSTLSLDGEIAVVTGGAGGIGAAAAAAYAAAGARVAVADLDLRAADAVVQRLGSEHRAYELDVRSWESVEALAAAVRDELGPATVLFNGAGIQRVVPTLQMAREDWDLVIDVNLSGSFRCCRVFGAGMVERGHGAIVNVASLTGVEFGGGGRVAYGASKSGIAGLTRTLGVEWAASGVRVNAIAPGIVSTPLIERLATEGSLDLADLASRVPAQRVGSPADVASLALLLSCPEGSYLVGQTIVLDGGLSSAGPRQTGRQVSPEQARSGQAGRGQARSRQAGPEQTRSGQAGPGQVRAESKGAAR